jgi:predicted Zn-dependent protease
MQGSTIHRDGKTERVQHEWIFPPLENEVEGRAEPDYRAMAEYARAASIRMMFVSYPREAGAFAAANRAMRQVAEQYGLAVVESSRAVERVPEDQREYLWAAHPNAPMYREIARDVAAAIIGGGRDRPQ